MHIRFSIGGNVIVDNVADALHIQTACRHIRRDDNIDRSALDLRDGVLALRLHNIAIQRRRVVTTRAQFVGQLDRGGFGAHKNNHAVEFFGFEHARQRIQLVNAAHWPITLTNSRCRRCFHSNGDLCRFIEMLLCDAANFTRHGGGEQRNLTFVGCLFQNPLHIVDKTHAQHFVGFIEHETF